MITREQKAHEIKRLSEAFMKAKATFVVDYKGMNVDEMTRLRKSLAPLDTQFNVVRNTLAKLALKDHPEMDEALSESFQGTNALLFANGDASAAAKVLAEFSKDVEELVLKRGVMDGQALDTDRITYLATLPGKDELRAKLLATFQAPMTSFVRTLEAVPGGFARLLSAYKDKQS